MFGLPLKPRPFNLRPVSWGAREPRGRRLKLPPKRDAGVVIAFFGVITTDERVAVPAKPPRINETEAPLRPRMRLDQGTVPKSQVVARPPPFDRSNVPAALEARPLHPSGDLTAIAGTQPKTKPDRTVISG
jgi:hypothetical protein